MNTTDITAAVRADLTEHGPSHIHAVARRTGLRVTDVGLVVIAIATPARRGWQLPGSRTP